MAYNAAAHLIIHIAPMPETLTPTTDCLSAWNIQNQGPAVAPLPTACASLSSAGSTPSLAIGMWDNVTLVAAVPRGRSELDKAAWLFGMHAVRPP